MSADDDKKVDPTGDTVAGLTREELLDLVDTVPGRASARPVDPMGTTQPEGVSVSAVKEYAENRHSKSSERVTAPIRAQTPTPVGRADTADPSPHDKPINPLASTVRGMQSPVMKRRVSYPPSTWDRQNEVITSAQREHMKQSAENFAGDGVEKGNMRLDEDDAREIITSRFASAGITLEADYNFHHGDLMVTLDGYDPTRRVGYAFLSHSDADVVTDFDEATELAFQELAGAGTTWVLVLHDADVPSRPALRERLEKFLSSLPAQSA